MNTSLYLCLKQNSNLEQSEIVRASDHMATAVIRFYICRAKASSLF
jgi:hypothetical protein